MPRPTAPADRAEPAATSARRGGRPKRRTKSRRSAALRSSVRRKGPPYTLAMVDAGGSVHYVSKSAQLLFQSNADSLTGRSWVNLILAEDRPGIESKFHAFVVDSAAEAVWMCRLRSSSIPKNVEVRAVKLLHDPDIEGILLFLMVYDR